MLQDVKTNMLARSSALRTMLSQLPPQALSVLYLLAGALLLATWLPLSGLLGWWSDSISEISGTQPRISRFLGYVDAAPEIASTLIQVSDALSSVVIEDTGDSGRGGALLQQQLRQLASEAGLTVVGSEVKEPESLDVLIKLRVSVQLAGSPRSLDDFFERVYDARPALFPQAVKLETARRMNRRRAPDSLAGTEDHLTARLDVVAYRMSAPDV